MKVAVIGSTGYLGEQICAVLAQIPEFEVVFLAANKSREKLLQQARDLKVPSIYLSDHSVNSQTASELRKSNIRVFGSRDEAKGFLLGQSVDGIFFALAGIDWIDLFYDLLETDKILWVATKEIIVAGSELWKGKNELVNRKNVIPLDSEHNALCQLLQNQLREDIVKIYLTASGGAFYEWQGDLNEITPEMALSHPNWKMGAKITIDSANLVNKGLEVVEANCLFGFSYSQVDVLVQRESMIHALIERRDGFLVALLSKPDMKTVIRHALQNKPIHLKEPCRIDFSQLKTLHFDYPVPNRFRGFYLSVEAGRLGGGYPAFFCGADEACVQAFLTYRIRFNEIPIFLEKVLEKSVDTPHSVSDVVDIYQQGLMTAKNLITQRRSLKC